MYSNNTADNNEIIDDIAVRVKNFIKYTLKSAFSPTFNRPVVIYLNMLIDISKLSLPALSNIRQFKICIG